MLSFLMAPIILFLLTLPPLALTFKLIGAIDLTLRQYLFRTRLFTASTVRQSEVHSSLETTTHRSDAAARRLKAQPDRSCTHNVSSSTWSTAVSACVRQQCAGGAAFASAAGGASCSCMLACALLLLVGNANGKRTSFDVSTKARDGMDILPLNTWLMTFASWLPHIFLERANGNGPLAVYPLPLLCAG